MKQAIRGRSTARAFLDVRGSFVPLQPFDERSSSFGLLHAVCGLMCCVRHMDGARLHDTSVPSSTSFLSPGNCTSFPLSMVLTTEACFSLLPPYGTGRAVAVALFYQCS